MTPEAQKELEGYTQFISEFDFELSKGQLNVSSFMGNLFQCLAIDRQRPPTMFVRDAPGAFRPCRTCWT